LAGRASARALREVVINEFPVRSHRMASALTTPRTEAELVRAVPASHRPGVFPRSLLLPGERVLFETRPSYWGRYWGRTTGFILFGLLFLGPIASPGYVENPAFGFFEALAVVLIVVTVLAWRGTAYALTNGRVLSVSGVRSGDFREINYDRVTNLSLGPGSNGPVRFETTPGPTPGSRHSGGKQQTIEWKSIPQSAAVYQFVQNAFGLIQQTTVQQTIRAALVRRAMQNMIRCDYCRAFVDLRQVIDAPSPKCPKCGAPLLSSAMPAV
jgi:hypothetical protein